MFIAEDQTLAKSGWIAQERQNSIEQVQTHAIRNGTPQTYMNPYSITILYH